MPFRRSSAVPALFSTTEPFLIAFFALYIAIAILFSLRQRPILRGYVDGTIVFGVPVVAFSLQSAMVHDWPFVTAYSAAAVSATSSPPWTSAAPSCRSAAPCLPST